MLNNKLRNILILLGVIIVLTGVYIGVDRYKTKQEDKKAAEEAKDEAKTYDLVKLETTDVSKIIFKTEDCSLEFNLDSSSNMWVCKDKKWELNQEMVSTILTAVTAITSDNEISSPKDVKEYGLDKPKLSVTLKTGEKGEYSFLLGDEIPTSSGGNYFMMKDGKNVYSVASTLYDAFKFKEADFIAVDEIDSLESDNISYVSIDSKDGKDFELKYDGDKTDDSKAADWLITKPYSKTVLGDETNVYSYLSNFASLSYEKCAVYEPKDLKKYGLDKPAYTVKFKYFTKASDDSNDDDSKDKDSKDTAKITKHEVTYMIGNAIKGTKTDEETGEESEGIVSYYVMSKNSKNVYTMAADMVEALVASDPFNCISKALNPTEIIKYKNVTITSGKDKYVISKKEVKSKDSDGNQVINYEYYVNDKKVKTDVGETAFSDIQGLSVAKEISKKVSDKKLVVELKYNKGSDTKDSTVKIYSFNDNFYSVEKDGAEMFLIEKQNVEDAVSAIAALTK